MGLLLNDREQRLFDNLNVEMLCLAGAEDVILWHFTRTALIGDTVEDGVVDHSRIDCLYAEPISAGAVNPGTGTIPTGKNYFPYKVLAYFEKPTKTAEGTSEGLDITLGNRIWFSRSNLEANKVPLDEDGNRVKEGDIFELFSNGLSWFFELKVVERDGFIHDSETWTQYSCEYIRNRSFIPERKVGGV